MSPEASKITHDGFPMISLASTLTNLPSSISQTSCSSSISATGSQKLSQEDIDKKPWKYIGYKEYSKFIASDDELYILRRFISLNTRVSLMIQDQISDLEEQLDDLDRKYSRKGADDVNNGSLRDDQQDRTEKLEAICEKLTKYNNFMMQQSELRRYPTAPSSSVKNIRRWHENYENVAIDGNEQKYLDHERDLICLVPKDKTPLRRLIDSSKRLRTLSIWKDKNLPDLPISKEEAITYYSDKRIDRFVTYITILAGLLMLIAPMWILQALSKPHAKLATITVFIIIFLSMVSYVTASKPSETLAATAAYSAVLMVFLQLGS